MGNKKNKGKKDDEALEVTVHEMRNVPNAALEGLQAMHRNMAAALQHQQEQQGEHSQLGIALNVLQIAVHNEMIFNKFEAEGMLDQAIGILKVALMTGPLSKKLRTLPDQDETP